MLNKFKYATLLALSGFKKGLGLSTEESTIFSERMWQYYVMEAAYKGNIFQNTTEWADYLKQRDLHPLTLAQINPTKRVVDFYGGRIYSGALPLTGKPLADNVPLAIPIDMSTPENLLAAFGQLWEWGSWQSGLSSHVTATAMRGDGPIEIEDDLMGGKVYPIVVKPQEIPYVMFDKKGDVIEYVREFQAYDPDAQESYTFTRFVSKKNISTYRNGSLFTYPGNKSAEYQNPYGFCPLVWVRHGGSNMEPLPGIPAVHSWSKIEEANSDLTRIRMYAKKQGISPQILTGLEDIGTAINQVTGEALDIEDMLLLTATGTGTVLDLKGNLNIKDAIALFEQEKMDITKDYPEDDIFERLAGVSQHTGPGTRNILAGLSSKINLVSMNYDQGQIKLHRMMVAIAGLRANQGQYGWSNLDDRQKKFLDFDLSSYAKGDLNFSIKRREVVEMSEYDLAETRRNKFIAMAAGTHAGIPLLFQLKKDGYTPDDIAEITKLQEEEFQTQLRRDGEIAEINNRQIEANLNTANGPSTTTDTQFLKASVNKPATGIPSRAQPDSSKLPASTPVEKSEKQIISNTIN